MLDEECGILEEAFHVVRCVEDMFQEERVYSESSLREMDKDGFYGCIRRIQFLVVQKEFVALAYLLENLCVICTTYEHLPVQKSEENCFINSSLGIRIITYNYVAFCRFSVFVQIISNKIKIYFSNCATREEIQRG